MSQLSTITKEQAADPYNRLKAAEEREEMLAALLRKALDALQQATAELRAATAEIKEGRRDGG